MAYNGVIKAMNELVCETKHSAIDGFVEFLSSKTNLDQDFHSFVQEFKKTIKVEKLGGLESNKKKDRPKRAPSPFNIFIRDSMLMLRTLKPELNNKDRMKAAIALWNEEKKKKAMQ